MATEPAVSGRLDPDRPTFVSIFGKKGEGKSVLARRLWDTWPRDELCIDVTGDALGPADARRVGPDVPDLWPQAVREDEPVRLRYVPDMRSSTYRDDLDRTVGLGLRNRGSLLWVDEIGVLTQANRTGPNTRRLLHQGRHQRMTAVFCGPRPVDIDPLVIAQSDVVYVFRMPNPADRQRVAAVCGIEPRRFDAAVHALGSHEYLRWDGDELVWFPPLPLRRARPPARDDR
jgi:hypothetical protein